jgi:hypothetical protein
MTDGETYEGVPLEELAINDIDWTYRGEYIPHDRSERAQMSSMSNPSGQLRLGWTQAG